MNADADTRLQNSVTLGNDIQLRVDKGMIERVSDRTDQPLRRATRQLRIRIQRQHVFDRGEPRHISRFYREWIKDVAQHLIQVQELATFALPTHPRAFARIIDTMPMK